MSENYTKIIGFIISSVATITLFYFIARPDIQLSTSIITNGSQNNTDIALTFDDGPHPLWMPLTADTLSANKAKGTFFIVGHEAVTYPEIIRQTSLMGHQIASHSMNHPQKPNLAGLPQNIVYKEINDADMLIGKICGQTKLDFRPPGGGINQAVVDITQKYGNRIIWWSNNAGDYDPLTTDAIIEHINYTAKTGDIILLHQRKHTIAALEKYFVKFPVKFNYITVQEMVK